MKITRDVVQDLLTVYLSGEATADTRALVEEWLKTDADLAIQVDEARRADLPPVSPPAPSVEQRAFTRTRRGLRLRAITLGVAIYVSTLPLTVTFNRHGFQGLMIQDWWERILLLVIAAGVWVVYFRMSRGLRRSGL
jgi:anti-sigma factor RsiW